MPVPDGPHGERARYCFGVFDFDAGTLELRKDGRAARVRPQSLRLLALLVARAGDLVPRDEIQRALWGSDTFVDFDQGVNHCIKELRLALGDAAESPRFIQTLPRRGYRFIAPVASAPLAPPPEVSAPAPRRRQRLWPWAAALAVAVAVVFLATKQASGPTPRGATLSVQPFKSPAGEPTLGAGLASVIAARLGGQQLISILPSGRAGDAALVLDGEIATGAGAMTVVARLSDTATGAMVWSQSFRLRPDELFNIDNVVAERVVAALNLRLAAAEQDRLRRRYTANADAYADYLRGKAAAVHYTQAGTREAVQAFERALTRDPSYALARAGLAMACADMYLRFAPPAEVEQWGVRTVDEARAALELDPDLAEAHLARAAVARKREFDWGETMAASRRALVLNPNLDQARFFMAAAYYHLGYMEEALIEMEKGRALHGGDLVEPRRIEALVALFAGRFVPARGHLEEVSRLSSQAIGDTYLALAHYYSGNVDRGRVMLASLASSTSAATATRSAAALAGVLAAVGQPEEARRQLRLVLARDYRDHHVAFSVGAAYAQLGDATAALRWLRTSADTGFPCLPWFERDPLLQPLRQHPDYAGLLAYVRARRESSLRD